MNTKYEIVYAFIVKTLPELFPRQTKGKTITATTSFKKDLELDSLDGVEFLLFVEEHFDAVIVDNDNVTEKALFQKAMTGTIDDMVYCLITLVEEKGLSWE